jgi:hypothetical protein
VRGRGGVEVVFVLSHKVHIRLARRAIQRAGPRFVRS